MAINRELIYDKLLEIITTTGNFIEVSRKVQMWTDVDVTKMPYLGLLEMSERIEQDTGQRLVTKLYPELYIYVDAGHSLDANPYKILNPILDKITALFQPNPHPQKLGNLVHSAKILGGIEKDGGILGTLGVAIIPLEIIVS